MVKKIRLTDKNVMVYHFVVQIAAFVIIFFLLDFKTMMQGREFLSLETLKFMFTFLLILPVQCYSRHLLYSFLHFNERCKLFIPFYPYYIGWTHSEEIYMTGSSGAHDYVITGKTVKTEILLCCFILISFILIRMS